MLETTTPNETIYCPIVKKEILVFVCTHKNYARGVYTKCKYFGGRCMHPENKE